MGTVYFFQQTCFLHTYNDYSICHVLKFTEMTGISLRSIKCQPGDAGCPNRTDNPMGENQFENSRLRAPIRLRCSDTNITLQYRSDRTCMCARTLCVRPWLNENPYALAHMCRFRPARWICPRRPSDSIHCACDVRQLPKSQRVGVFVSAGPRPFVFRIFSQRNRPGGKQENPRTYHRQCEVCASRGMGACTIWRATRDRAGDATSKDRLLQLAVLVL